METTLDLKHNKSSQIFYQWNVTERTEYCSYFNSRKYLKHVQTIFAIFNCPCKNAVREQMNPHSYGMESTIVNILLNCPNINMKNDCVLDLRLSDIFGL